MNYLGVDTAGGGFNPLAAGVKQYGGGRSNPTMGRVDPTGYIERDAQVKARRNAILQYLQASQQGQYMSPAFLRGGMNGATGQTPVSSQARY